MINYTISNEYSKRINAVINFILENLKEELSLKKIAAIANYSPFHFQKLFKQITGESPKQFIIRLRLENSARCLIIDCHKSITEIALDNGFSSIAAFARAFKNYFGISAEELRGFSPTELLSFRKLTNVNKNSELKLFFDRKYDPGYWKKNLKVSLTQFNSFRAISFNTPMSDINRIQSGYKKIIQYADFYDLLTPDTKFIGKINPLTGLFKASVTLQSYQTPPPNTGIIQIESGKFATYKIKGDSIKTIHSFHTFYELWLSKTTYRIKHHYNFEILSLNPLTKPYYNITREIYIPIETYNHL